MTTENEVTLEEEEWFHDADRSSIIDPWHEQQRWGLVSSCHHRNYRRSPPDTRCNTRCNIYDDLHSKNEREHVWKATEWLADQNPLCDVCRGLDIQPMSPSSERALFQRPQVVGYLTDIVKKKDCPLCRLISCAFLQRANVCEAGPRVLEESQVQVSLQFVDDSVDPARRLSRNLLRLTTSLNSLPPAFLIPLGKDTTESTFLGLEVKSEYIDFGKLKSWLPCVYRTKLDDASIETIKAERTINPGKLIDDKHLRGFPDFANFRLIDIESHCLVRIPNGCSPNYLTLSYVWGSEKCFLATKTKIEFLEEDRSLFHPQYDLPRTIKDAITITGKLGHRYLWVDALCIVQDDDDERAVQIKNMGKIYENSRLTIINASGVDANSGFEGVYPHRRKFQQHIEELKPGLRVTLYQPMDELLKRSVWQTRAWTFQEHVVSARRLIFLNGLVYFENGQQCYSEDLSSYDPHMRVQNLSWMSTDPILTFTEFVSEFTERRLSYEIDIMNAWAGVAKAFDEKMQSSSFFGLPAAYFDLALLWKPTHRVVRRKGFPSWSWVGWVGKVHWETTGKPSRLIFWYKQIDTLRYRLVASQKEIEAAYAASRKRLGESSSNAIGARTQTVNSQIISGWQAIEKWPDRATKPSSFRHDLFPAFAQVSGAPAAWPYLHFWTFSALFRLSAPIKPADAAPSPNLHFQSFTLTGCHERLCGFMTLENCWESRTGELVEVLVLSGCENWDHQEQKLFADGSDTKPARSKWSLWNVMLIEWHEGNVAERVGLGKILKSALNVAAFAPGKQWKEITLG